MKTILHSVFVRLVSTILGVAAIACPSQAQAAASDAARIELESCIQNIGAAAGLRYGVQDNLGNSMDCAKIIANPYVSGQFLAVYHSYTRNNASNVANVNLATSTDLLTWTYVVALGGSSGANATQPCIAPAGAGMMVAWEQNDLNGSGNSHLRLAYYPTWSALQSGAASQIFDAQRSLSGSNEGTPNIYSATPTSADIGFHYFNQSLGFDRQARGQMSGWNSWTTAAQPDLDNAILYWGRRGAIGGRDNTSFNGCNFLMMEGGGAGGSAGFANWRVFLYDVQTKNADILAPQSGNGLFAFANPKLTVLTLNGRSVLVVTTFVPSENNIPGTARELIYYNYIGAEANRVWTFACNSEGWNPGTAGGPYDSATWSRSVGNSAPNTSPPAGSLQLDGSDLGAPNSAPNSWFYKTLQIPLTAATLSFDTRGADATHGGQMRVRLVDAGEVSHTLLNYERVTGEAWVARSANISAYAGATVSIYFEQNDSGTGSGESRYVDNIALN